MAQNEIRIAYAYENSTGIKTIDNEFDAQKFEEYVFSVGGDTERLEN